ncbi:hypothetical protein IQ07DRAFT_317685 [Pyrenochaeta sp. DS3sAY3a]|nr:hypothetical protein IQ07DRAFT_317685 [Pyrenochaeta sp. DS3sAY3a]
MVSSARFLHYSVSRSLYIFQTFCSLLLHPLHLHINSNRLVPLVLIKASSSIFNSTIPSKVSCSLYNYNSSLLSRFSCLLYNSNSTIPSKASRPPYNIIMANTSQPFTCGCEHCRAFLFPALSNATSVATSPNPLYLSSSSNGPQMAMVAKPTPLDFHTIIKKVPMEIALQILAAWMAAPKLTVEDRTGLTESGEQDPREVLSLVYKCATNLESRDNSLMPPALREEYQRLYRRSWHLDTKEFTHPYNFYMSHVMLGACDPRHGGPFEPPSAIYRTLKDVDYLVQPEIKMPFRGLKQNGLEKIELDLSAEEYFSIFRVRVPPFDQYANRHHDAFLEGTGVFLAHTEDLTLHFGTAYMGENPWYATSAWEWIETNPCWLYGEAKNRPNVCTSGKVIDWILEYAWHHGMLQHIPRIRLTGVLQPWVRAKWYDIFARHAAWRARHPAPRCPRRQDRKAKWQRRYWHHVHKPDIEGISTLGLRVDDSDDDDEDDEESSSEQDSDTSPSESDLDSETPEADVEHAGAASGDSSSDSSDADSEESDGSDDDSFVFGEDDEDTHYPVQWAPEKFYPPRCMCGVGCSRLNLDGTVSPKIVYTPWPVTPPEESEGPVRPWVD